MTSPVHSYQRANLNCSGWIGQINITSLWREMHSPTSEEVGETKANTRVTYDTLPISLQNAVKSMALALTASLSTQATLLLGRICKRRQVSSTADISGELFSLRCRTSKPGGLHQCTNSRIRGTNCLHCMQHKPSQSTEENAEGLVDYPNSTISCAALCPEDNTVSNDPHPVMECTYGKQTE